MSGKQGPSFATILVLGAIAAGLIAAAAVIGIKPELSTDQPTTPPEATTATVDPTTDLDEGQEIMVDEDSTNIPNVTPPDTLSLIMRNETRDGKTALERCQEYGGDLTLDMVCHGVDY